MWRALFYRRILKVSVLCAFAATMLGFARALYSVTIRSLVWTAVAFVLFACALDVVHTLLSSHTGLLDADAWKDMMSHYNETGLRDAKIDTPMASYATQFLRTLDHGEPGEAARLHKRIHLKAISIELVCPL